MLSVIKRDGRTVPFDSNKISNAISKAYQSVCDNERPYDKELERYILSTVLEARVLRAIAEEVEHNREVNEEDKDRISVEQIQDIVENELMNAGFNEIAKSYILYREKRSKARAMKSNNIEMMKSLIFVDSSDNDTKRENGNIDGNTSMGLMLKIGSENSKEFALDEMIRDDVAKAHRSGDIHIHDLDFYPHGTTTCIQIPLDKLFQGGFSTGHGYLRPPKSIRSYSSLLCIAIQSSQNDFHGGQSIPCADIFLAPGVNLSFQKALCDVFYEFLLFMGKKISEEDIKDCVKQFGEEYPEALQYHTAYHIKAEMLGTYQDLFYRVSHLPINGFPEIVSSSKTDTILQEMMERSLELAVDGVTLFDMIDRAVELTERETYQAMEALIHNLNTLHSRSGGQVPFSSINFGMDTSDAGRLVSWNILKATMDGMGNGETAIFPISIFVVKEGINYNPGDPNYDLFQYAIEVTAKRLYPNFCFQDADFNMKTYDPNDYRTWIATMGCRTRVVSNVNGPSWTHQRGNLSFTSINLPRIALKHMNDPEEEKWNNFYDELDEKLDLVRDELLERYRYQCSKHVKNFPFQHGEGEWLGSEQLGPNDTLESVLKHGTLSIGFIGLAETLVAMTGKHHGESAKSQEIGLQIISYMRLYCDTQIERYHLNFSLLATPAEGLSGTFIRKDKKIFGEIPGITDRDYYTNSFHVPVYYEINCFDKISIEAPYHKLCNAGHITYVELDGDTTQNLEAMEEIIRWMKESNIGYGSLNHPVDYDPVCGYVGVIGDYCPRCGRKEFEEVPVERLKHLGVWKQYNAIRIGYHGDVLEEEDRIPNPYVIDR